MTTDAVAYFEETPDNWADEVAQTWTLDESDPDRLVFSGTCPTCQHPSTFPIENRYGSFGEKRPSGSERSPTTRFIVTCRCKKDHPGRPFDRRWGCGRYAPFDLTP